MAKTNYQIFNEENAPERTYNDSEYKEATQRVGGVMPGMALSLGCTTRCTTNGRQCARQSLT